MATDDRQLNNREGKQGDATGSKRGREEARGTKDIRVMANKVKTTSRRMQKQ